MGVVPIVNENDTVSVSVRLLSFSHSFYFEVAISMRRAERGLTLLD